MMDLHAIQGDKVTHVLTTHRRAADETPLQMISNSQLDYYVTIERALLTFVESIVGLLPLAPPSGRPAPSESRAAMHPDAEES